MVLENVLQFSTTNSVLRHQFSSDGRTWIANHLSRGTIFENLRRAVKFNVDAGSAKPVKATIIIIYVGFSRRRRLSKHTLLVSFVRG